MCGPGRPVFLRGTSWGLNQNNKTGHFGSYGVCVCVCWLVALQQPKQHRK